MFRFCCSRLAIGAYSLFMMEQKNNPALKGLAIAQRGKMTSKLYKALSPVDRAALEKRAKSTPSRRTKTTKTTKTTKNSKNTKPAEKRTPSAYAQFVKTNIQKFSQLPHRDRMTAVAKLWKQQQAKKM